MSRPHEQRRPLASGIINDHDSGASAFFQSLHVFRIIGIWCRHRAELVSALALELYIHNRASIMIGATEVKAVAAAAVSCWAHDHDVVVMEQVLQ